MKNTIKFTRVVTTNSYSDYGCTQYLYVLDDKGKILYVDYAGNTGLQDTSFLLDVGDNFDNATRINAYGDTVINPLDWDGKATVVTSRWKCVTINNHVVLSDLDCHMDFVNKFGNDDDDILASDYVINLNPKKTKSKRK